MKLLPLILLFIASLAHGQLTLGPSTNFTVEVTNLYTTMGWVSTNAGSSWNHYATNATGSWIDGSPAAFPVMPWTYDGTNLVVGNTNVTVDRVMGWAAPYNAETLAFATESGATDLDGIDAVVTYVKAQGLWTNFVMYPMKSEQNAGSGATVYGIGGLTTNDMTLVNAPSWASNGIVFAKASSQYGNIGDAYNGGDLYLFARIKHTETAPSDVQVIAGSYNATVNKRSFVFLNRGTETGDPYDMIRSSDGGNLNFELYRSSAFYDTNEKCLVAFWGTSRNLYANKTNKTLTLISGSAQTGTYDSDQNIYFAANNEGSASGFSSLTGTAFAVFSGSSLTTTQRETLTDLINAL